MHKIQDLTPALFKFQSHRYAKAMFDGEVYVSNISDFRNTEKHKLTIGDPMEGITNYISCDQIKQIVVNDYYIYCTTRNFISDSLFWAQENKKECCVMISSPEGFFDEVNRNHPEVEFCGSARCTYKPSKTLEFKHYQDVLTDTTTRLNTCLIKDFIYTPQMEYRAIWRPTGIPEKNTTLKADISNFLINIHYSKVNEIDFKSGKTVTIKVIRRKGAPTIVRCKHPHAIFTPITFSIDNTRCLGFSIVTNHMGDANFESADMPIYSSGNFHIVGINAISNISQIEFE